MRRPGWLAGFVGMVLLAWCWRGGPLLAAGEEGSGGGADRLSETRWVLSGLVVDGVSHPLEGMPATSIRFAAAGKLEGKAAVNTYQGSYAGGPAGELRWPTPIRATRLGGPAELQRLEAAYLNALARVARWEIVAPAAADGRPGLRLGTADGKTVLTFQPSASGPD